MRPRVRTQTLRSEMQAYQAESSPLYKMSTPWQISWVSLHNSQLPKTGNNLKVQQLLNTKLGTSRGIFLSNKEMKQCYTTHSECAQWKKLTTMATCRITPVTWSVQNRQAHCSQTNSCLGQQSTGNWHEAGAKRFQILFTITITPLRKTSTSYQLLHLNGSFTWWIKFISMKLPLKS